MTQKKSVTLLTSETRPEKGRALKSTPEARRRLLLLAAVRQETMSEAAAYAIELALGQEENRRRAQQLGIHLGRKRELREPAPAPLVGSVSHDGKTVRLHPDTHARLKAAAARWGVPLAAAADRLIQGETDEDDK